jgi:hypothetical protein
MGDGRGFTSRGMRGAIGSGKRKLPVPGIGLEFDAGESSAGRKWR